MSILDVIVLICGIQKLSILFTTLDVAAGNTSASDPHIVGLEALSNKPIVGYYMSIV